MKFLNKIIRIKINVLMKIIIKLIVKNQSKKVFTYLSP